MHERTHTTRTLRVWLTARARAHLKGVQFSCLALFSPVAFSLTNRSKLLSIPALLIALRALARGPSEEDASGGVRVLLEAHVAATMTTMTPASTMVRGSASHRTKSRARTSAEGRLSSG